MIKYSVAMGIRVLCIISILFVPGWWAVIPAIGAVLLPYFAVVIANVGADPRRVEVQRPGNILPMTPPAYSPGAGAGSGTGADGTDGSGPDARGPDSRGAGGTTDAPGEPGRDDVEDDDEEEGDQREHGT